MSFKKSVRPADVGVSNWPRKRAQIVFLTPPTWKRAADIPPGVENKDLARTRAIAKWPNHAERFKRKCDVDRAEACLIGWAGLQREARGG